MKRDGVKLKTILILLLLLLLSTVTTTLAMLTYRTNHKENLFTFEKPENVLAYYEIYQDDTYGFYYYDKTEEKKKIETLKDQVGIKEAGYAVLSNYPAMSGGTRDIGWEGKTIKVKPKDKSFSGKDLSLTYENYYVYAVSQTKLDENDFAPLKVADHFTPGEVAFDGEKLTEYCIPNYAKGVYKDITGITENAIRTPQQMQNITAAIKNTKDKNFTQELTLDFSKKEIGGITLTDSVVKGEFLGTYNGQSKAISKVALDSTSSNIGLFSQNAGTINEVSLTDSNIKGGENVGGIVGTNSGVITGAEGTVFETSIAAEVYEGVSIAGTSYVAGVAGRNTGTITNVKVRNDITITATNQYCGGIVGQNSKIIETPQVYGMFSKPGEVLVPNTVTVSGGTGRVGGIAGSNEVGATIIGSNKRYGSGLFENISLPMVGGYISLKSDGTGTGDNLVGSHVGGIAGYNSGALNQATVHGVSVKGNDYSLETCITIEGTGNGIGGIVGYNDISGTIVGVTETQAGKVISMPDVGGSIMIQSSGTSAISPAGLSVGGIAGQNVGKIDRVNVRNAGTESMTISGTSQVGGIVGTNGKDSTPGVIGSENSPPVSVRGNVKIKASLQSAGGIVGYTYSNASIVENSFVYDFTPTTQAEQDAGLIPSAPEITSEKGNNGGIVGTNFGHVRNSGVFSTSQGAPVKVTGVKGDYVGGIVGFSSDGDKIGVNNCAVLGNVEILASRWVGGIIGGQTARGKVEDCKVGNNNTQGGAKNLISNAKLDGGIVVDKISGDAIQPSVSGNASVGGYVGQNEGAVTGLTLDEPVRIRAVKEDYHDYSPYNLGGIVGINAHEATTESCGINMIDKKEYDFNPNDGSITAVNVVGGIVGANNGKILDCNVRSDINITGTERIGGIVGETLVREIDSVGQKLIPTVDSCRIEAKLVVKSTGGTGVGGIAGSNATQKGDARGQITNCVITGNMQIGDINSWVTGVGGITGVNSGDIKQNSIDNPSIHIVGSGNTGGVAGINAGNIEDNAVLKYILVTGKQDIGGIAGTNQGSVSLNEVVDIEVKGLDSKLRIGGIVGNNAGSITSNPISGTINVDGGTDAGGIAGVNSKTVSNNTIKAVTITGGNGTGGIVGSNTSQGTLDTNRITDNISATGGSNTGGIAGVNAGTIENCEITGKTASTVKETQSYLAGIGGIVGSNSGIIMTSKINGLISVNGTNSVGGIVGASTTGTVSGCEVGYMAGSNIKISSALGYGVGGIAGKSENTSITTSKVGNASIAAVSNAGGIAGEFAGKDKMNSCEVGNTVAGVKAYGVTISAQQFNGGGLIGKLTTKADFGRWNKIHNASQSDNNVKATAPSNGSTLLGGFSGEQDKKGRLVGEVASGGIAYSDICIGYASVYSPARLPMPVAPAAQPVTLTGTTLTYIDGVINAVIHSNTPQEELWLVTTLQTKTGVVELDNRALTSDEIAVLKDDAIGLSLTYAMEESTESTGTVAFHLYSVANGQKDTLLCEYQESISLTQTQIVPDVPADVLISNEAESG